MFLFPSETHGLRLMNESRTSAASCGCISGQNQDGPKSKPSAEDAPAETLARFDQPEVDLFGLKELSGI